jgi:hypothetical protein
VLDRLAFPRLGLAAVLGQCGGAKPQPQAAEPTAGLDRGELLVVAHQDDLGSCLGGVVQQPSELAGAEHSCLVHHQHAPLVQHALTLLLIARVLDTSRIRVAARGRLTLTRLFHKPPGGRCAVAETLT